MKVYEYQLEQALKKASCSPCKFRVAALAYDCTNRLLGITTNIPRLSKKGGGLHAEMNAILRFQRKITYLVILRINKTGHLVPLHPCEACSRIARKYDIQILTLLPLSKDVRLI